MAGRQNDEKARRLAAALRENLKRRKAQGRGRDAKAAAGAERQGEPDDSAPSVAGTTLSADPDAL